MVDEYVAQTQSASQAPAENTSTGTDVSPKTYRPVLISVIINALSSISQGLVSAVIAGLVVISTFGKEFNISENARMILIYICVFIALIAAIVYLWQRIHFAKSFSITSDSIGLTLRQDKKTVKIDWNEVVSFQKYKVVGTQKDVIYLPKELGNRDNLKGVIEKNAAKSITEHLVSQFHQQGKVTLGVIDITNNGLLFKEQFIAWEDIAAIVIDEQIVKVIEMPGFQLRHIAPVSEIPSYYALGVFVELLRPQRSGVRRIEEPNSEKAVVDEIIDLLKTSRPQGGISIDGVKVVNIVFARGDIYNTSNTQVIEKIEGVSGTVNVASGNITTHQITAGLSTSKIEKVFEELYMAIEIKEGFSLANKDDLVGELKETKSAMIDAEEKKSKVDEDFLAKRFRHIARIDPAFLDVVVEALANPLERLGVKAKNIAESAKKDVA